MEDTFLKWWPVGIVVIGVVLAIGRHHEKIKVLEEKVHALFELWNEHMRK